MQARPNSDVIDRIRKILKRTEEAGCTEAEAQTAMMLASRLLAEYNLDMSEFTATEGEDLSWTEDQVAEVGARWTREINSAYFIVKQFCYVEGIIHTTRRYGKAVKTLKLFGKAANVETGRWMFSALIDAFERLWTENRAKHGWAASERRIFVAGVAEGFRSKMQDELRATEVERDMEKGVASGSTALAVVSIAKETADEFKRVNGKLKQSKGSFSELRGSASTFETGLSQGRSLKLNRAVGVSAPSKKLASQ